MRRLGTLGLVFALAFAIGCGKSEQEIAAEKAAEDAKAAAEAIAKAATSAAQAGAAAGAQGAAAGAAGAAAGLEGFAKAMEGMAAGLGGKTADGKPIEPVSFRDLETVLPDVSGWTRDKPRGERMTSPIPFSQTEAQYNMGNAGIEMKIVDSGFSQLLIAPWSMFIASGYSRETSSGYEKSVTVGGNPGFEKWDSETKYGELNFVVAKRFLVTLQGNGIADTKILNEFASKMDMGKLASLK